MKLSLIVVMFLEEVQSFIGNCMEDENQKWWCG